MNLSGMENVSGLPLDAVVELGQIAVWLKTIGVAALIYFVYMVFMAVLNYKKLKRLGVVESKVDALDKKLDKVLRKRG